MTTERAITPEGSEMIGQKTPQLEESLLDFGDIFAREKFPPGTFFQKPKFFLSLCKT